MKSKEGGRSSSDICYFALKLCLRVYRIWKSKVRLAINEDSRNRRTNREHNIFEIKVIMCMRHLKPWKINSDLLRSRSCGERTSIPHLLALECITLCYKANHIKLMLRCPWSLSASENILVRGSGPELPQVSNQKIYWLNRSYFAACLVSAIFYYATLLSLLKKYFFVPPQLLNSWLGQWKLKNCLCLRPGDGSVFETSPLVPLY